MNAAVAPPPTEELITWVDAEEKLPDSDTTVLVFAPGADDPVWVGYHDGCFWFGIDDVEYDDDSDSDHPKVTHWADLPAGPK